jgi:Ca-activated chloride channel homolog
MTKHHDSSLTITRSTTSGYGTGLVYRRGMKRLALLATAVLVALAAPAAVSAQEQPDGQDQAPRFRSAVDLVSVAAVVRDRKGRFVRDLTADDFLVVEAGAPREILGFRSETDGPVSLAILFDVSGSMRVGSKAWAAREAARTIFAALRPSDQAALFSFDTKLQRVRDFTSDFGGLASALETVDRPFGQTSLYDAVAQTAGAVARAARRPDESMQRAAVIVITDGIDTKSRLKPSEVSGIASRIDVPVYVLAVMSTVDDESKLHAPASPDAGSLRDLAQWTGGELFTANAPERTAEVSQGIVAELRHQYLLAFEASPRPGWRTLEVKARNPDLVVRARSGYTAGERLSMDSAEKGLVATMSKDAGDDAGVEPAVRESGTDHAWRDR